MADRRYDFLYDLKTYKEIPCQVYCPVHTDVEKYIHLIAEGKWAESHALIRETNPFPSVCGRVCQHPCEDGCNRQMLDKSVSIRTLKRAATDYSTDRITPKPLDIEHNLEKVAVVGAGPAGLTAAYDLARLGYRVTVYEAEAHPGGMLRYGIPAYRLPREVIDREVEFITSAGVEIKYNTRIGKDIMLDDLRSENKAVLMAAGAWDPALLEIPGERFDGVIHGAPFMIQVNKNEPPELEGKTVVVIGGGFTAMDVSRSAIRLGAKEVNIVYRRTRAEIPVIEQEIIDAEAEDVKFHYLQAPLEILAEDGSRVSGIKLIQNELGEPDASGRRRPVPIEGSEFVMDCDIVVPAVSQVPNNECLNGVDDLARNKWGNIDVDMEKWTTSAPDVFACGDYPVGTTHAIKVIAEGHQAAVAIDSYLRGTPADKAITMRQGFELHDYSEPQDKTLFYDEIKRCHDDMLEDAKRVNTFEEVELGVTKEAAINEANRCFQCRYLWTYIPEVCIMCANCVDICPQNCLSITPLTELQFNRWMNEGVGLKEQGVTGIEIDRDLCIRCAFCRHVCPTDAITFSCYSQAVEKQEKV